MSIDASETALVIIDIQEKLMPTMDQAKLSAAVSNIHLLVELAQELNIPIVVTEQYPKGLGKTIPDIIKILDGKKNVTWAEKVAFGCCDDDAIKKTFLSLGRRKLILTGMETHVCVYLTALGLRKIGAIPFIPQDAVLSASEAHHQNGLELCREAGSTVTNTQTLLFQLMQRCDAPYFKKISQLLKDSLKK